MTSSHLKLDAQASAWTVWQHAVPRPSHGLASDSDAGLRSLNSTAFPVMVFCFLICSNLIELMRDSALKRLWPTTLLLLRRGCQHTKAEHGGPRGLLRPLPLPSLRGGMIGLDWLDGLPTMAAGFDMIQNHVELLSGKVHAAPTRSTATAMDAALITRDLCLRPRAGFPDALLPVVDHDAEFSA